MSFIKLTKLFTLVGFSTGVVDSIIFTIDDKPPPVLVIPDFTARIVAHCGIFTAAGFAWPITIPCAIYNSDRIIDAYKERLKMLE